MKYLCLIIISLLLLSGCGSNNTISKEAKQPLFSVIEAKYTTKPVKIDGKLDDAIWQEAKVYEMNLSRDKTDDSKEIIEGGQVQLAWDDDYLYLSALFIDSDIVAENSMNQEHHYQFGDVCELFLKPADKSWYWELYVTPKSNKTCFWFPGWGRFGLPSNFENINCNIIVAAQNDGSINNWKDKDAAWTAEMAVPIKDLTGRGEKFGADADWRILIARYNYSVYLDQMGPEYSMVPQLPVTNFHFIKDYGKLKLVK